MMKRTKIYIDKQSNNHIRLKPYRLRVMRGTSECIAIYFDSETEAKRAKSFARKIITSLQAK